MDYMSDMLKKLEAIYKAAATDFKISGALTDQQTEAWFKHVFDKGQFINRVTRVLRSKLSGNTGFIEGSDTAFTRTAEGTEMTNLTAHTQRFSQYLLLDLDLPSFVGYSVLDDNPGHDLLNKLNDVNDQSAANSLQNLAINGIADDYAGSAFLNLMTGWIKLGKDSSTIKKVNLVVDDLRLDDLDALVEEMILELAQEHRQKAVVLMSDNERRRRNRKIVENSTSTAEAIALAAMTKEQQNTIGGKPVLVPYYWPDEIFMLTDPANLEIDIHREIRRTIEEKPRKKGFEYTYVIKADCEIIHHKEACISYI